MDMLLGIPVQTFESSEAFEAWLRKNYEDQTGTWIKIAKKDSGVTSISHLEALDVCLCYGWIDGQRRSFDATYFLQKYTPRRKRSLWSKVNIGKVEVLVVAGRMQTPGQAEIDRAKADGRWDAAYDSPKNAVVPDDLTAALAQNAPARESFESLNKTERYAMLWQLMTASTPEVRQRRLDKILDTLSQGSSKNNVKQ